MKSFVEIVEYLLVTIFLSGWLSQDSLEKFFGCQRQRGKSNENPNAHDFCKNTQALRVINTVCKDVPRGNCRGSKHSIDWEAESKHLPKRRRFRSANKENASDAFYKNEHPVDGVHPARSDHPDKSRDKNGLRAVNDNWNK